MQRSIPFSAVFNFRDLGGYPALDGSTVRWTRLFRSDTLSRLAEADREAFDTLGIRTVIDLRRPYEVERDGRSPTWDGLRVRHIDPRHQEWDFALYSDESGVARYLADRYHDLAEEGADGLARAIGVIADAQAAPTVVHCVAGKDRTGVIAAMTLELLGVSDEDIAADYALTEASVADYHAWLARARPELADMTWPLFYTLTPPEAILLFLAELRRRHGSVERYLSGAGLTADQVTALREHLLA